MKRIITLFLFILISTNTFAQGTSTFSSEISHFAGGAVSTGVAVVIIDNYFPEQNSAWIGFTLSSTISALAEYRQYKLGENSAEAALLDAASHTLGAAIGAYFTDKYLITPALALEKDGSVYTGINVAVNF
ncbi:MAG: hypothetical protein OQK77_09845 [Psychromonas sp.]|nr:hypothetical protein [Psychromonas sp.]